MLYFKIMLCIPDTFFIWYSEKGKIIPLADLSMSLLLLLVVKSLVAFVQPDIIILYTLLILNIY